MDKTIEQAKKELANIEASFSRLINQIRGSCIDIGIKETMLDDLNDMASEVHHLIVFEESQA